MTSATSSCSFTTFSTPTCQNTTTRSNLSLTPKQCSQISQIHSQRKRKSLTFSSCQKTLLNKDFSNFSSKSSNSSQIRHYSPSPIRNINLNQNINRNILSSPHSNLSTASTTNSHDSTLGSDFSSPLAGVSAFGRNAFDSPVSERYSINFAIFDSPEKKVCLKSFSNNSFGFQPAINKQTTPVTQAQGLQHVQQFKFKSPLTAQTDLSHDRQSACYNSKLPETPKSHVTTRSKNVGLFSNAKANLFPNSCVETRARRKLNLHSPDHNNNERKNRIRRLSGKHKVSNLTTAAANQAHQTTPKNSKNSNPQYFQQIWTKPKAKTFDLIYELRSCPHISKNIFRLLNGKELREAAAVSKFWYWNVNLDLENVDKILKYNESIVERVEDMVLDSRFGVFSSPTRPSTTMLTRSKIRLLKSVSPVLNRHPNEAGSSSNASGNAPSNPFPINNNDITQHSSPKTNFRQRLLKNLNFNEKTSPCLNCGWTSRLNINTNIASCNKCKYNYCKVCYSEVSNLGLNQMHCLVESLPVPSGDNTYVYTNSPIPTPLFSSNLNNSQNSTTSTSTEASTTTSTESQSEIISPTPSQSLSNSLMSEIEVLATENINNNYDNDINSLIDVINVSKITFRSKNSKNSSKGMRRRSMKKRLNNL